MCGIVAFIHQSQPVSSELISKATQRLIHRGPDAQGTYRSKNELIGLGATRLQLVDLSDKSNQPFTKDNCTLIFNGEIYNYRTLRQQLQNAGYSFTTSGDTEVIIAAYTTWGTEKAVKSFRGCFAFIIHDAQQNKIIIARDIFGERQLVYTQTPSNNWLFASETKAFIPHPEISLQPDIATLAEFMALGFFSDPHNTFFQNIKQFPSAHFGEIDLQSNTLLMKKYWDHRQFTPRSNNIENYSSLIHDQLKSSVLLQTSSADVDYASIFSGGIDSSLITALATQMKPARLDCITAKYKKGGYLDNKYIQEFYDYNKKIDLHYANFPEHLTDEFISHLIYHHESPLVDLVDVAMYFNYETAKKLGFKTVLNGQGADELWLGYYYGYEILRVRPKNPLQYLQKFFWKNHAFSKTQIPNSTKLFTQKIINDSIEKNWQPSNDLSYLDNMIHFFFDVYLKGPLKIEDHMSMANSVEVRLPFMSQELVELAFRIPAHRKIQNQQAKYLLRQAGKNILPLAIQKRAKTPFPQTKIKLIRQLQNKIYRETICSNPLVQELCQANKEQIATIYPHLTTSNQWYWYTITLFDNIFFH